MSVHTWVTLAVVAGAAGEPGETAIEAANRRAIQLVDLGIAACGGRERLEGLSGLRLEARGTETLIDQGPASFPPWVASPIEESLLLDLSGARFRHRVAHDRPGYAWEDAMLGQEGRLWSADPEGRTARASSDASYERELRMRVPPLLLLEARARGEALAFLGIEHVGGREERVVGLAGENGSMLAIHFDAQIGAPTRVRWLETHPTRGDVVREREFGTVEADRLCVPRRISERLGDEVVLRLDVVELELDPVWGDDAPGLPEDYAVVSGPPRPTHRATELAEGVYVLEQVDGANANVLLVSTSEGLVAIDAPEEPRRRGLSSRVIETARSLFPDRPLRAVVPTHHHVDHGGGLRDWIAAGAAIVTTPGNRAFVESAARASFERAPDALALAPRTPRVEVVRGGRWTLGSGEQRLEVVDVGPDGHADENLVAWLPGPRILFVADLFETGYREDVAWDGSRPGARLVEGLGWQPVWLVTAHSRPRRVSEMKALADR